MSYLYQNGTLNNMKRSISGFTIVELLIVIVVIAILAAISIVAYNGVQERARTSAHAHTASQAEREITTYALQVNNELISIGGGLVGYKEGAGDIELLRPLTGTPDITMYAVYEVTGTGSNYAPFASISPTQTGQMFRLQTNATGNNGMSYRIDTSAQAASSGIAGFRVPGNKVIGWLQVSNNATTRAVGYNQAAAQISGALTAHSGWTFTRLTVMDDGGGLGRIALVFNAAHDQATRAQIISWLAQKYGVSL